MNHALRALPQCMMLAGLTLVAGCQTAPTQPPLRTVANVDLQRFVGDWYVVGHIPTFIEKTAHNAVESYSLNEDGTIATTFKFNQNAPDGKVKTYTTKGFISNTATNAEWGMQFAWPVKADFKIVHLDDNYQEAIVARDERDYVWILSRTPNITPTDFDALLTRVRHIGYDVNQVRSVPHRPES